MKNQIDYSKRGSRTDHLMEECGELIQILAKTKRFGLNNWHPRDKGKTPNWKLIFKEMEDVEKRIKEARSEIIRLNTVFIPFDIKEKYLLNSNNK